MSHYKPYPAYKDSGVEWLGRVPEHWQVKQLKYLASHIGSGKTPSGGAEVYQDAGVLFLRSQNVYEDGLWLDDAAFISDEVDEEMKASRVKPGDVLLNITGASIGRSCLVPEAFERANVNQHVCIIRGEPPLASKWISLCLPSKAVQAQIDFSQNGAGREGLNFEQIGNMFIALPHAEEVDEIASRLDRETARIGALIEKKTRFIELLREKRQALITHAVTKGLNPGVSLKDSSVEWLGEVPEHWVCKKLMYWMDGYGSGTTPSKEDDYCMEGGLPWVTTGELREGLICETDKRVTDAALSEYSALKAHPVGSLVIAMYGATVGRLGLLGVPAALNQACFAIHPCKTISIRMLRWWFEGFRAELIELATGAGQPNISGDKIRNLFIAAPLSLAEQEQIADQIESRTLRIDGLVSKTERSIELLKERRSALITAAVTGQIDLREAV